MRGREERSGVSGQKALFLAALMLIMTQVNYIGNSPENKGLEVEEEPKFTGIATVDQLFSGDAHSCAFNSIGSLKCWGNGSSGQLGIGSSESMGDESDEMSSNLPFVDLGTGLYPTSMALGNSHSCAIFVNGSLKCWGEMKYLGLGFSDSGGFGDGYGETGDNLPFVSLPSGLNVTSISAGHHHTCAVFNDSNMTCWGENSAGQLGIGHQNFIGDGANEMGDNLDMIDKPTGKNVSKMALGMEHTCVIWDDGSVSCWGENQYGQLGIGSSTDVGTDSSHMGDSLATVSLPSGTIAVDITAGSEFTCVLLDDNSVRCWGKNDRGQLGIGSTATKGTSSAHMGNSLGSVDFDDGFTSRYAVALDAGTESVCVILDNSDVKCWGANSFGQLGIGNVNDELDQFGEIGSLNDVSLGAGKTAKSLQVGNKFACAKLNDDNLKCWGSASEGRLGYENTETRGDSSADMGNNLPVVDLGLDGELGEVDCDQMFDPIHDSFHSSTVESNADVGMNNSITLRQNGCPAIAYINQDSDHMMFAVYFNGFWTLEQPTSSGGVVVDTHIAIDSVGNPHIVHVEEADSADEIFYTTKVGGIWATAQFYMDLLVILWNQEPIWNIFSR